MIQPTVGRILWYIPHVDKGGMPNGQPHAAILAHVINERSVNLAVFNEDATLYSAKTSVRLLQEDDPIPPEGDYAMWMPYQVGQAKKTEEAEAKVAANPAPANLAPAPTAEPQPGQAAPAS